MDSIHHDFSIYATCDSKRRSHIFNLLSEDDTLSPGQQRELAKEYGCSRQTVYYDVCLFKAAYDDNAFRVVLKKKWTAQDQRAKKYGVSNTLTLDQLRDIFERANGTCQECGRRVARQFLVPDHIIDMGFGGSNSADNLRVLCALCNIHKARTYNSMEVIDAMETYYITTQEAASALAQMRGHDQAYTVRWIQSLIDRKKITAKKFGRDWMVSHTSLVAYASRGGAKGAPPQKGYVTISQAADILNVTPTAIYSRVKVGTIESITIDGYIYIDENQLEAN